MGLLYVGHHSWDGRVSRTLSLSIALSLSLLLSPLSLTLFFFLCDAFFLLVEGRALPLMSRVCARVWRVRCSPSVSRLFKHLWILSRFSVSWTTLLPKFRSVMPLWIKISVHFQCEVIVKINSLLYTQALDSMSEFWRWLRRESLGQDRTGAGHYEQ